MTDKRLVSICIPTFNGSKFILEALKSAVNQTYENIEILISDDASNDNTLELIKSFRQTTKIPIRIFNHKPSGIGANWNHCIRNAKGYYIKFLFQDDILLPNCVEKLVAILANNENVGLVACKRSILVEGRTTANIVSWKQNFGNLQEGINMNDQGYYLLDSNLLKDEKFLKNNKIGEPSTILFPSNILKKTGFFREDLIQVLDFEFYYRILKHHKIIILNQELAGFRIHPAQATNMNKNKISIDYERYYKLLYEDFFWFLSFKFQKKLIKRYHPIGKLYSYLRH